VIEMEWEEAISDAKEELGYSEGEYIEDWDEVVETAKEIMSEGNKREYENYLDSPEWKETRSEVLKRDNYTCQDCGGKAENVHHLDYDCLETDEEAEHCVSLCRDCHRSRHNL